MELWILLPLVSSLLMASVNVVDKFFVLEGDDNLDYKSFCLYSGGMQILIFAFLFIFDPINLNELFKSHSLIAILSGVFFGLSLSSGKILEGYSLIEYNAFSRALAFHLLEESFLYSFTF